MARTFKRGRLHCNATYDGVLCWPATGAGATTAQHCPRVRFSDTNQLAYRQCSDEGFWLGRDSDYTDQGWTNYSSCFPDDVLQLLAKFTKSDDKAKFQIAEFTRILEIIGFTVSLITLLISIIIFSYYRSLRNNRTRIHKSMFSAMMVQVVIRLTLYIDQAVVRTRAGPQVEYENGTVYGIDNMPYLCETTYVLLEYAITSMFLWMFVEGLHLHNVVTANALRDNVSHRWLHITCWGLPVLNTGVWAGLTGMHYHGDTIHKCWFGYNFTNLYWILQALRLGVIMANLVFLLNIMRVLIVKLRKTRSTEMERVKKAAKAALVLLPLLGTTNILSIIEPPADKEVWIFGLWSYSTHFLRSFQGFFISLIYCFMNEEVRTVISKHYLDYIAMRNGTRRSTYNGGNRNGNPMNTLTLACMSNKWLHDNTTTNNNITSQTEMGKAGAAAGDNRQTPLGNTVNLEIHATAEIADDDPQIKKCDGGPNGNSGDAEEITLPDVATIGTETESNGNDTSSQCPTLHVDDDNASVPSNILESVV